MSTYVVQQVEAATGEVVDGISLPNADLVLEAVAQAGQMRDDLGLADEFYFVILSEDGQEWRVDDPWDLHLFALDTEEDEDN